MDMKRGFAPVLLEADDRAGGRLIGDKVDGFSLDAGADFFCSSYDATFRICEELGLSLVRSEMNLRWFRDGRWATTTSVLSVGNPFRNLPAAHALRFQSPRAVLPNMKLFRSILCQSKRLSFATDSRIAEIDGEEGFGEHLERLGATEYLQTTLRGYL